jgi:hypothetical protein
MIESRLPERFFSLVAAGAGILIPAATVFMKPSAE